MRSYDGRMHALDPTKVEERSILIDESLTLCCVQQCPSRPYSVLRELNVPLDGKPDETVHIQIYDEVSLIETFGDFAVVSVRGTHAIVRITDIEALPESIVGQRLAV
ncbi:MAG: hypothetical protein Q8L64_04190 [bacterium]|nr:hypothetical protein [bacterium]